MTPTLVDVQMTVNGELRTGRCEPRTLLVDFLRDDLRLTGTHVGCEHGVCGACTIHYNGKAVRSCILLTVQANGAELRTVEGLMQGGKLHPLQEAFHKYHGLQCGFCTPGMMMAALDFLTVYPNPTVEQIRKEMASVICRCTGYRDIVRAIFAAAEEMRSNSRNSVLAP